MIIHQVDAFSDRPFSGNPAAVCILPGAVPDRWMQDLAMELNLSETAFVLPCGERYRLRWFTPTVEVDLCGHATLASAHVLWETGLLKPSHPAVFDTLSGELTAFKQDGLITLDFPAEHDVPVNTPAAVQRALGCPVKYVGRNKFDFIVELNTEAELRNLNPDPARLAALNCRGLAVTARSQSPEFDFISRFFAPAVGVPEDPVTGSSHCMLAPYWCKRLGKQKMTGYQASHRGGVVRVEVRDNRVLIAGQAITVMRIELLAAARPPG